MLLIYLVGLLGTLALLAAGVLVASLAFGDSQDDHAPLFAAAVVVAAAWGLVPSYAFFVHLLSGLYVAPWLVVLAALGHGLILLRPAWRARVRRGLGVLARLKERRFAVVIAAALAMRLVFALAYDPSPPPPDGSCIYSAALTATGDKDADLRLLVENVEDARLGNTAVISGFVALYQGLAFRELYASCGTLLALGGFLLGLQAGGRRLAWFGLLLLPLNPWVFGLPQADQNLLTLSWSVVLCALLLRSKPPWLLAGLLFGLVVAMRHVMILAVPAVALLALTSPQRGRALGLGIVGFFGETTLELVHHHLALGSVFRFESNAQFPALPYRVLGLPIRWEGLMNWPLHDTLVRTPHRAFPNLLAWPLHIADHLGLLLASAALLGSVTLWRRSRREAAFWVLWFGPAAALLALQESWDVPNKMGVMLVVFAAILAWTLEGVRRVVVQPQRFGPAWLALVLLALVATRYVASWDVPVDARYHAVFPEAPLESPRQLEQERARESSVGLLPDYGRPARQGRLFAVEKLVAFGRELADPRLKLGLHPWGWFEGQLPEQGEPVTVAIDLGEAPWGRHDFITLTDRAPHLDLVGRSAIAWGIDVPWETRDLAAYGMPGDGVTALALVFERPVDAEGLCACAWDEEFAAPCDGRCSLLYDVAGVQADEASTARTWDRVSVHDTVLVVRVPAGGLSVATFLVPFADRFVLWTVEVGPEGIKVSGPFMPWHS